MTTEINLPRHVALYRDICQHAECVTRRLAYADLLDEIGDERVECPKCEGKGYHYDPPFGAFRPDTCDRCRGKGVVLAMPDAHDRAEFIRVQVELAMPSCQDVAGCFAGPPRNKALADRARHCRCDDCVLRGRLKGWADELLAAHPEWRKCPCPGCEVEGVPIGVFEGGVACRTCGGTGDLFVRLHPAGNGDRLPRPVTFSRGFPDSVECTAADVWWEERKESRNMDGDGWATRTVPTEWALAVVRCAPVTRFVLTSGIPDTLGEFPEFLRDGGTDGNVDELAAQVGKWVRSKAF